MDQAYPGTDQRREGGITMLSHHEVRLKILCASTVFTEVLMDELNEMQHENVTPVVEARWVRSRQKPDYMYCSGCFEGYDAFEPDDRVMLPVKCRDYFIYCPLCGADMVLDVECGRKTPRFEDEMSDEERTAGNERKRAKRTPDVCNYDDMKHALGSADVYIPHGDASYLQKEE
jgi:hypothetical protein